MTDSSVSYKCPNCGAPLSFLPGKKTITCEHCGTEFEVSAIDEFFRDKRKKAAQAASLTREVLPERQSVRIISTN